MFLFLILSLLVPQPAQADPERYRIFDSSGAEVPFEALLLAFDAAEAIFIGEQHNDPVAHEMTLELLARSHARFGSVALLLEMFERDIQEVIDEYMREHIRDRDFHLDSRPWQNYAQDYSPLVEYARTHSLPVLASNAPRRYVNRVSRLGRDALMDLTTQARGWLPPLPYPPASEAYAGKFEARMQGMTHGDHANLHLLDAQVLRDASMGYATARQLMRDPGTRVIHLNGAFHSDERLGAPEHLVHYRPGTRFLVVSIVSDSDFPAFDRDRLGRLGDFIILTDPTLPRTY